MEERVEGPSSGDLSEAQADNEVLPVGSPFGPSSGEASATPVQPPRYVARHFMVSGGSFYFKQRPDLLAFCIRGQSFRARDDSALTATAIVEMAAQRGWLSLRVRGTDAFRRAVWFAAAERLGKRPVEVRRAVRDALGEISYHETKVVERRDLGARVLGRDSDSRDRDPSARASEDPEVASPSRAPRGR